MEGHSNSPEKPTQKVLIHCGEGGFPKYSNFADSFSE